MAVIKNDTIVAPTSELINPNDPDYTGTMTLSDLDSVILEPGFYLVKASKTINGQTESIWNVTCIGDNVASNPVCYMQIWVPASSSGLTTANQNIYVRTINSAGTGFGNFTTFISTDTGAVNKTSYPMEIYAQTTQPTAQVGKTIIWIDTN